MTAQQLEREEAPPDDEDRIKHVFCGLCPMSVDVEGTCPEVPIVALCGAIVPPKVGVASKYNKNNPPTDTCVVCADLAIGHVARVHFHVNAPGGRA